MNMREPTMRKFVVGESLSRQVCRSLMATATLPLEVMEQHVRDTGSLITKLAQTNVASFSARHRSRLLKAVVTAQDRDIFFPLLDNALESHAWDHIQVVVQRLSAMDALQPDSEQDIVDGWSNDLNTMRRLVRFVLRCTDTDTDTSSHTLMAGKMVKAASETYPRGNGESESVEGASDVRSILDSYIRVVASVYATIKPEELARDSEIFESFMRMIKADGYRSVASALSHSLGEQSMDADSDADADDSYSDLEELELDVDEILVTSDGDADIMFEVNRDDLLSSSFSAVMAYSDEDWQTCETLDVRYSREVGLGEGVARDWIGEISTLIFYQSGLFSLCPDDPAVVHPSIELADDNETFAMMEFAGRILGIARRLGIPTGVHLSTAAILMITLKPLEVLFLAQLDPELARSCAAMRIMDEVDVDLGTFVSPGLGCELFPGGSLVPVTAIGRKVFADMLAERHIRGRGLCCAKACYWIARGLLFVMASDADAEYCDTFAQIQLMNAANFNAIFGGEGLGQVLRVDDWHMHTDVTSLVVISDQEIAGHGADVQADNESDNSTLVVTDDTVSECQVSRFLFQIIKEMNMDDRRKLLRFWIGTSSLPHGGFGGLTGRLRLVVMPDSGVQGRLPSSHTCVRTLVLPFHHSISDLRKTLHFCLVSMSFHEI